jgi:hypothetical protein
VNVGDDDGDVLGLLRTRRGRRWRLDGSDTVERWLSLGQAQAQFGSQHADNNQNTTKSSLVLAPPRAYESRINSEYTTE